jgi:hypothetical protein
MSRKFYHNLLWRGGILFWSRGQGSEDNLKKFVEAMSIRVITACPAGISEKFGQTPPERLIELGLISLCKHPKSIQCLDRGDHYALKSCNHTKARPIDFRKACFFPLSEKIHNSALHISNRIQ